MPDTDRPDIEREMTALHTCATLTGERRARLGADDATAKKLVTATRALQGVLSTMIEEVQNGAGTGTEDGGRG